MNHHYKAVFADGTVLKRSSTRIYAAAYLARGTYPARAETPHWMARAAGTWKRNGFSISAEQAKKTMEKEIDWMNRWADAGWTIVSEEVVAVIEIDEAEYRKLPTKWEQT